jgi:hypothetical protein
MGTGFHDLQVWREAKALAVTIYTTTATLRDQSLRDQMRRSAVSVPSNIAEGDERDTTRIPFVFSTLRKGRSLNFAPKSKLPWRSASFHRKLLNLFCRKPPSLAESLAL